jgi:hypothetical protein
MQASFFNPIPTSIIAADIAASESVQNKTSSSLAETNNKLQGMLIVTK